MESQAFSERQRSNGDLFEGSNEEQATTSTKKTEKTGGKEEKRERKKKRAKLVTKIAEKMGAAEREAAQHDAHGPSLHAPRHVTGGPGSDLIGVVCKRARWGDHVVSLWSNAFDQGRISSISGPTQQLCRQGLPANLVQRVIFINQPRFATGRLRRAGHIKVLCYDRASDQLVKVQKRGQFFYRIRTSQTGECRFI